MVAPQSSVGHHVGVILMTLTKLRHPVVTSLPDQLWSMTYMLPLPNLGRYAKDSYIRGVGDPFADAEESFDPVKGFVQMRSVAKRDEGFERETLR